MLKKLAKEILKIQITNCLFCNKLRRCKITKSLTQICIGKVHYIQRLHKHIRSCPNSNVITQVLKLLTNNVTSVDKLYVKYLILNKGSHTRILIVKSNVFHIPYIQLFIKFLRQIKKIESLNIQSLIDTRFQLSKIFLNSKKLSIITTLSSLGLDELSYLIITPRIEDVYISGNSIYVVLDNSKKCVIKSCSDSIIQNLLKLSCFYGNVITFEKPYTRFSIKIGDKCLRISIDKWPIVPEQEIHIRVHKKPFTIIDLIKLKMLSVEETSNIITTVLTGRSLLVLGEPGSGKTTLVNAIDMTIPRSRKRVYIDEVDESINLPYTLQIKYRSIYGRLNEVLRVLYRGGGVLIIGELREIEHYQAFLQALYSGLQVLTTSHALSINDFIDKVRYLGVDLKLKDITIVQLQKVSNLRKVLKIENLFKPDSKYYEIQCCVSTFLTKLIEKSTKMSYVTFYNLFNKFLENLGID